LVALYLVAGGEQSGNILKNFTPLLIRNHVANNRIAGLGPEAEDLDEKSAPLLAKILIQQSGRGPEDLLLSRTPDSPRVLDWVMQALLGKIDQDPFLPLLGDMRKLGPEKVGPPKGEAAGVVVEERHVPPLEGGAGRLPKEDWVPLAERYQKRFLELNSPLPSGGKDVAASSSAGSSAMASTTPPSWSPFGGELKEETKAPELPKFGPGLEKGTLLLIGGKMEAIIEKVEVDHYMAKLIGKGTSIKLVFTHPSTEVLKLP